MLDAQQGECVLDACGSNDSGTRRSRARQPTDQRFHASVILGFTDTNSLRAFFGSGEIATLSAKLPEFVSAVHAYEVTEALTYVNDGKVLPHYQT